MECLGVWRLLEVSLAAGQIRDPIRASLMRKRSLTPRENEEGRTCQGKKGSRERKGREKTLHEPRNLISQSVSFFHRGKQEIASSNSHNCPNFDYEWAKKQLCSFCVREWDYGDVFLVLWEAREGQALLLSHWQGLWYQVWESTLQPGMPPGSQALC